MKLFELDATINLDSTGFDTGVTDAESKGKTLAEKLGADADSIKKAFDNAFSISIGTLIADGFKKALGAAWDFVSGSVEVASNLEEIQNVVDTVFGKDSTKFDKWAKDAIDKFGMGELAAKQYASTIASVLSAPTRGFNADEVYGMSTTLTQLIGDIASFRNLNFDDVFTMILSGLRGETESIERLGIDMRAGTMAAFLGIKESDWGKLSDYEQTMTRYQFIMNSTARMQGDFERTQGSYANQQRLFDENLTKLQATIGESLLPTMTGLLTIMNEIMGSSLDAENANDTYTQSFVEMYAQIGTTAAQAYNLIDKMEQLENAGLDDPDRKSVWDAIVAELSETLPGIEEVITSSTDAITNSSEALRQYTKDWEEAQRNIAISEALSGARTDIANTQKRIAELQIQYGMATMTEEQMQAEMERIVQTARDAWNMPLSEGYEHIDVATEIAQRASRNDPLAMYLAEQYSFYAEGGPDIITIESQIAAARAMLADQEIQMAMMEEAIRQLNAHTGHTPSENPSQPSATDDGAWISPESKKELERLKQLVIFMEGVSQEKFETEWDYEHSPYSGYQERLESARAAARYVGTEEAAAYLSQVETYFALYAERYAEAAKIFSNKNTDDTEAMTAADELAKASEVTAAAAEEATAAASVIAEKGEKTAADDEAELPPMNITINLTLDGVVEQTVALTMEEIARQTRTKSQTN